MDTTRDLDLDRSFERLNRHEEFRSHTTGYGTTRQSQALTRKYLGQLADRIRADRARPRNRKPWRALKDIDDETLALRLLVAGISVCGSDTLGADKDNGEKNFRDIALCIARNIGIKDDDDRELLLRVGNWSINMLLTLPIFVLGADHVLLPSELAIEFVGDFLAQHIKNNPLLSPLTEPPQPWTGFTKGGLPSDHWARVSLIRPHHPSIDAAAREAIRTGQMQPALDAINYLAGTPFTINKPVLDFMRQREEPRIQKLGADIARLAREGELRRLKWLERQQLASLKAELGVWELDMVTAEAMADCQRLLCTIEH